jgi:hypothetical protein
MAAAAALTLPHAPKAATAAKWGYFSHLKEGARQAASLPGVAPLMIFIAAAQALMLSITDYWQLFARELGLSKSGIALFIGALSFTIMVVSTLAHRLKTLPLPALHLLFAATGAGLAASASITEHWALIGPVIFVALYWIVEVNADARFQHALRPETRATVGSLKGFAMQLTNSGLRCCGAAALRWPRPSAAGSRRDALERRLRARPLDPHGRRGRGAVLPLARLPGLGVAGLLGVGVGDGHEPRLDAHV